MLKITILVDNRLGDTPLPLENEHGLSIYVQTDEFNFLCDVGLSSKFASNSKLLGIDLTKLDFAFLSHAHIDHTGGLEDFLAINTHTPIYLSALTPHLKLFSSRHSSIKEIGSNIQLIENNIERFRFISENMWINDTIAIIKNSSSCASKPYGNKYLSAQKIQENGELANECADDFCHELTLAIKSENGLIIISSCSHAGAINIINSCVDFTKEQRVHAFIGGLHFVDSEHTQSEVQTFKTQLQAQYPLTKIITGHCTGTKAEALFADIMPEVEFFHTGDMIII